MLGPMGDDDDHERLQGPLVPQAIELPEERVGSIGLGGPGLRGRESGAFHEERMLVGPILLGKSHGVPANPRPGGRSATRSRSGARTPAPWTASSRPGDYLARIRL